MIYLHKLYYLQIVKIKKLTITKNRINEYANYISDKKCTNI